MPLRRTPRTFLAALALTAPVLLGVTGCDADPAAKSPAPSGPSVLVPGAPGEENRTLSAADANKQRAEDDSPNTADVAYARMMIQHHGQALDMTELVADRAESTKVKRLAERIAASQGPEIGAMRGWLESYGKSERGTGHDHAAMPGMATEAQLKKLRAARGSAFDQLFLTLMITHHEGALSMATDVKAQGNNIRVEEMADDTIAQQTSEITRMRDML
ncbi:DUF305 domain-containing protein [Streptomyces griseoviridis]|uniref:DUF305 domain-containing protein n=1 Tax=Streptomyces griseoviridis TaxID=45398 RepID=A0A3S9ZM17_STRGD|nr:DUF305 domain-containing protein [Streptomyces griseoviridis]AZS88945.1 DUF305 domain-containing protein [Streptomyces griseoviridis]QCN84212.1 DUF305 domain-containing protein [Streptomyces griseoviridis]